MSYVVTTAAASEPISLTEAKNHLRVDEMLDDGLITSLIVAARELVAARSKRTLINTTFRVDSFGFPGSTSPIRLRRGPLSSVTTVKYYDTANTLQTIDSANYVVDTTPPYGIIEPISSYVWPVVYPKRPNAVQVTFVAGYGADSSYVPAAAKTAMLLLIGNWYENRESVTPGSMAVVPMAVDALIGSFSTPEFY